MKKITCLLLTLLLLASCNTTLQTENDVENTTIIPRKQTISSIDEIDLCTNYHRNDTLFLQLLREKRTIAYPFSELKNEYLNEVKAHRVTLIPHFMGETDVPVIIMPSTDSIPSLSQYVGLSDKERKYQVKSILKDASESDERSYLYFHAYMDLYLLGYDKAGNKLLFNNNFFFSAKDLEIEKTSKALEGGMYSVTVDKNNKGCLCQMKYDKDNDMIILRLANGDTYRYPTALTPWRGIDINTIKQQQVSAVDNGLGRWLPSYLTNHYDDEYGFSEIIPGTDFLLHKMGSNRISIESVKQFFSAIGMSTNAVHPGKFFFTEKEMKTGLP